MREKGENGRGRESEGGMEGERDMERWIECEGKRDIGIGGEGERDGEVGRRDNKR